MARKEMTGLRFGRLVVTRYSHCDGRRAWWEVKCDCGTEFTTRADSLRSGKTQSCGCLTVDINKRSPPSKTHGMSKLPEYRVWNTMIQRCNNPNANGYSDYGKRGIKVCQRWRDSFEAFFADMGPRPGKRHTIERINNNGNYEPGNCCWLLRKLQPLNTRATRLVTFNGKTQPLTLWAKDCNIPIWRVYSLMQKEGITPEQVIARYQPSTTQHNDIHTDTA